MHAGEPSSVNLSIVIRYT